MNNDPSGFNPNVKISILMITYNQGQYVAQAINSILMQQVNFSYEVVIGEDCSLDQTRSIVENFQNKYPEKIRLLPSSKNLGVNKNFIRTFQACRGQYIAVLEGDDYWTASSKLQKQADFLDTHPDYVACFHNVVKFYQHDGQQQPWKIPPFETGNVYTINSLLQKNFIPTCSILLRNKLFEKFPKWFDTVPLPDWALFVLSAQYGKIGYIDEVMAVYRVHHGGVWSSKGRIASLTNTITAAEQIRHSLSPECQRKIDVSIFGWCLRGVYLMIDQRDYKKASVCARKCLSQFKFNRKFSVRDFLTCVMVGFFPYFYHLLISTKKLISISV